MLLSPSKLKCSGRFDENEMKFPSFGGISYCSPGKLSRSSIFVSFILVLICVILLQVWFLGENANYAASEYAWESATPPGTALMMLDADKMVAAASSRNPTLAGALTRLQRCAFSGSWEVKAITLSDLESCVSAFIHLSTRQLSSFD